MNNMDLLSISLAYMEDHLCEDIKTEDVARECYCSKSTLEKLFRCVEHISVHDYIVRRRMMKAARLMMERQDMALLDIALMYGYSTNESFTRAFKQVWNCKPSEFRKNSRFSELFPRIIAPLEDGDEYMRDRRHVDISELYDLFRNRQDCYFVCCDIKHMMDINEISRKAGDLSIIEEMRRMEECSGPEDIVFRIGGDEFALLTNSNDKAYAEEVAEKIRALNGSTYAYEDQQIPLNLHVSVARFQNSPLRYSELFTSLHEAIKESK